MRCIQLAGALIHSAILPLHTSSVLGSWAIHQRGGPEKSSLSCINTMSPGHPPAARDGWDRTQKRSRIHPGADGGAAPSRRHRSLLLSGEAAWSPLTRSSAGVKRRSCKEDINHTGLGPTEPFTQSGAPAIVTLRCSSVCFFPANRGDQTCSDPSAGYRDNRCDEYTQKTKTCTNYRHLQRLDSNRPTSQEEEEEEDCTLIS